MLKDVLASIADKPERMPMPEQVRHYLEQHRVPLDIIEDLAESSYANWLSVGAVDLIPIPRLIEETTGIAMCMEHGFLPVAGCRNFDVIVVNRETRRVSYASHELLWSSENLSVRECLLETPFDYETFWEQAVSDPAFPWDYYEASDRWPTTQGKGQ